MSGLKGKLAKAGLRLVGVTGGVLSIIALGGLQGAQVPVLGWIPKAAVHTIALAGSSLAASYIVPAMTPYVSGGSPQLTRFDELIITPLVLGTVFLGCESLISPSAEVQGPGGTLKEIAAGAVASVTASYLAQGLGMIPSVLS